MLCFVDMCSSQPERGALSSQWACACVCGPESSQWQSPGVFGYAGARSDSILHYAWQPSTPEQCLPECLGPWCGNPESGSWHSRLLGFSYKRSSLMDSWRFWVVITLLLWCSAFLPRLLVCMRTPTRAWEICQLTPPLATTGLAQLFTWSWDQHDEPMVWISMCALHSTEVQKFYWVFLIFLFFLFLPFGLFPYVVLMFFFILFYMSSFVSSKFSKCFPIILYPPPPPNPPHTAKLNPWAVTIQGPSHWTAREFYSSYITFIGRKTSIIIVMLKNVKNPELQ